MAHRTALASATSPTRIPPIRLKTNKYIPYSSRNTMVLVSTKQASTNLSVPTQYPS
uniref:Uncharacterized protein n=1 Tax=Oryza brachyantha TaxID=4533 RepID=J3M8J3_ORYBR